MSKSDREATFAGIGVIAALAVALAVILALLPLYRVYNKEQSGKAALREAEHSKLVQIEEAKANLESEALNARAEVERAKGMAEAMDVEGGSLTPEYIQYLWVRQNRFNDKTTIYIPTEGNLPVLEGNPHFRRP